MKFFYVHKDGFVTDDIQEVLGIDEDGKKKFKGKCVAVLEQPTKKDAQEEAERLGYI